MKHGRRRNIAGTMSVAVLSCAVIGAGVFTSRADSAAAAPSIARIDRGAAATERGKYPPEMVVGPRGFDGAYRTATGYASTDRRFVVALWESDPGILKTDNYPHDEYCFVITGDLVITNRSGSEQEFHAGDSFVIPKGWAGTWNMKTPFKKQYVAFTETPN